MVPVRKPRSCREYATILIPNSLIAIRKLVYTDSISRVNGENSISVAIIGWTIYARLRVRVEHFDRPRYLIFPMAFSSAIAFTVPSIGV
jgi:hypothetical protein